MPTTIYSVNDRRALPTQDVPSSAVLYGEDAPYTVLYNSYGVGERIKKDQIKQYLDKGYSDVLPTIAVTGTAIAGGVTEAQVAAGAETLIFTLANGIWATDPTPLYVGNEIAGGWNAEGGSSRVRTSDTVLTVTVDDAASYSISADEVVFMYFGVDSVVYPNGVAILQPVGIINGRGDAYIPALTPAPTKFTVTAS